MRYRSYSSEIVCRTNGIILGKKKFIITHVHLDPGLPESPILQSVRGDQCYADPLLIVTLIYLHGLN